MRRLIVFLLVVAGLLVVADRAAAYLAADEAEQRLAAHGFVAPSVDVGGFPFLTQLIDRRFPSVSVRADAVRARGGRATDISGDLHDVRASLRGPARVGRLTARGTVPYREVERAVGVPSLVLAAGPSGELKVSRTVDVLGQSYRVAARARIEARGRTLRIVPTTVALAGGGAVDEQLSVVLADRVALDYRIPDLPHGVRVEQVTAGRTGLLVRVSGRDVRLPGG